MKKEGISAEEMGKIYWSHRRSASIGEVENLLRNIKSDDGKAYWNEVLQILLSRKKRTLH